MKWFAAAFFVHTLGCLTFFVGWKLTFGVDPRVIPASLDVIWPIADLLVTGVISGICALVGIFKQPKIRLIGSLLGAGSLFLSSTWLYVGLAAMGIF